MNEPSEEIHSNKEIATLCNRTWNESNKYYWLSNKERRVDALALRADERRDKLRKASGSCK